MSKTPPALRLSDAEWRLMSVLWSKGPSGARAVLDAVVDETGWAYTTVKTMLDRLVDKGALATETVRNAAVYSPLVTKEHCRKSALRSLLRHAFDGAAAPLVAHLLKEERLSKADREAVAELLAAETAGAATRASKAKRGPGAK
jgi:BlaI family transcriptional regulator, penicillinase repressor